LLAACGAAPAPAPYVARTEPAPIADAGPPAPTAAPRASAPPVPTAAPSASAAPPPPPITPFTETHGGPLCHGAPRGQAVAFEQTQERSVRGTKLAGDAPAGDGAGKRIVWIGVGETPGSSVAWAVETAGEVVLGVRVPAYCGGAMPPDVTIRVALPAGTKPIRAVLCDVDPCNFGAGPGPP
jgi:hypothetical protein